MKCDIIIPIWNQLEHTKNCIDKVINNTRYSYRLILVDNGSDSQTRNYLIKLKNDKSLDVVIIRNENNLGFVRGVNQGLAVSDAPYVCILNNDTIPTMGWLERLVEFAESHNEIGIVNPLCSAPAGADLDKYAESIAGNKNAYMEMNQCFLFCALIKREVIEKIGYLDEAFGMGCYDDTDYSMRAGIAGYRCASVHSSCVHHLDGTSFKALGTRKILEKKGAEVYFKKWPRHLRIGVACSIDSGVNDNGVENLLSGILFLARQWCWINLWIFGKVGENKERVKKAVEKLKMPPHQNIKFNYMPGNFSGISILLKLLERSFGTKRRKKYDIVMVDNEKTASFLKTFSFIHSTEITAFSVNDDMLGTKSILDRIRKK